MNDGRKMTALPYGEVRERLLSKRQDAFQHQNNASAPGPGPRAEHGASKPADPGSAAAKAPPPENSERICAYAKCGVKFTPRRPDQIYHSADCRKRAWFDRNFAPIAKETPQP